MNKKMPGLSTSCKTIIIWVYYPHRIRTCVKVPYNLAKFHRVEFLKNFNVKISMKFSRQENFMKFSITTAATAPPSSFVMYGAIQIVGPEKGPRALRTLFLFILLLSDFQLSKTLSIRNRLQLNFAQTFYKRIPYQRTVSIFSVKS